MRMGKIRKEELEILPAIMVERYARMIRKEWPNIRQAIEDTEPGQTVQVIYKVTIDIGKDVVVVVEDEP